MLVHRVTPKSINTIKELGENYPDINYKKLWNKILYDFHASLRQLEEMLFWIY